MINFLSRLTQNIQGYIYKTKKINVKGRRLILEWY